MLDKTWEGSWVLYCDECGAYFSDLLDPGYEPEEVICQECLDKGDEGVRDAEDWREKLAHSLEERYGTCPYGRKKLIKWIDEEVMHLKARGVPAGDADTLELQLSYWGWISDDSIEPFLKSAESLPIFKKHSNGSPLGGVTSRLKTPYKPFKKEAHRR